MRKLGQVGIVAGVAGTTAALVGLKKALDLGGRLSDVASNTGLLAGEALILERALSDAGIAGEKLQPTIQKMQRAIVEGGEGILTYRRAFEALGLSMEDLRAMAPGEQFAAIQKGLAGMADPAERSARAMQIFGRSGGELGALFSNPEAMKNAAESVGSQADILNRSADSFDRSADILGGVGSKISGFFVGMASYINPVLLPVLEEMNKLDFSKYGQQAGKAVSMVVLAFKSGGLSEIIALQLVMAGKKFLNFLINGFLGLGRVIGNAVSVYPKIFKGIISMMSDPKVWSGLGRILKGLGIEMAAAFVKTVPRVLRPNTSDADLDKMAKYGRQDREAGGVIIKFSDSVNALERALLDTQTAGEVFGDQMGKEGIFSTTGEAEAIKGIIDGIKETLKESEEKAAEKEAVKPAVPGEADPLGLGMAVMKPVLSSMQRIGGATIRGARPDQMDRQRNRYLKVIADNTARGSIAVYG